MRHLFFLAAAFALVNSSVSAQDLPRSASFGAKVGDLTDSSRAALNLSSSAGSLIREIIAGSSAQNAGFLANDVLVSMDGEKINKTADFLALLKKHHGGDKVKIEFYRNAKLQKTTMMLLAKPKETSVNFDIIYSSVVSGNNHLRTIMTKPKGNGVFPAVLLIGGVGCYSIDNPIQVEIQSIKMWADSLALNGFVTMRVEKTGMGDSKGISCNDCDFNTEKQGYLDGLKQLKSLAYVDKQNVYMAGFSIGGVVAPLIAQQEPVKGIIVYGTVGRNWLEYEIDNTIRQQTMEGPSGASLDNFMRAEYIRLYELFVEKKKPEQILKEHPEMETHLLKYPMKIEYFQQVADVNIREMWMKTKTKVLAMHGTSDFVSSGDEHQLIAEIVNFYNPGNAVHAEITNCDHWSLLAENELASASQQQKGLTSLPLRFAIDWLKDK